MSKDQRPAWPIGQEVIMTKPYGNLRPGDRGYVSDHHPYDHRVRFRINGEIYKLSFDPADFMRPVLPGESEADTPPLSEIPQVATLIEGETTHLQTQIKTLADALRPFAGEAQILRNLQIEGAYGGGCKYHSLEEYERVDAALAAHETEMG